MSDEPISDGGPAFPVNGPNGDNPGMSLRDYFAAQALAGFMASQRPDELGEIPDDYGWMLNTARSMYGFADAMIQARAEG